MSSLPASLMMLAFSALMLVALTVPVSGRRFRRARHDKNWREPRPPIAQPHPDQYL